MPKRPHSQIPFVLVLVRVIVIVLVFDSLARSRSMVVQAERILRLMYAGGGMVVMLCGIFDDDYAHDFDYDYAQEHAHENMWQSV